MRKTLLLSFVLFISAIQLSAQFQKNEIYGGLGYGRWLFNYNTNSYQASLSVGLNANNTIGVFLDHTRYNSMPSPVYNGFSQSSGLGISHSYARFFKNSSKWGWYVNSSLGFHKIRIYEKQNGVNVLNVNYPQQELSVTPGIFFKPSPRILLFANIGAVSLTNNRYEFKGRFNMASQLNVGITIGLGNFGKKKR
jgi:hypothetical protein